MTLLDKFFKRVFDLLLSLLGALFSLPIILVAWIVAALETRSNGFFIQQRVGKDGKLFNIIKIKTMKKIKGADTSITASNDRRITKSGAFFRNTKIDELPQLWNVFLGQMSFVGPRPDVLGFADLLQGDDRLVLSIRPGITGPASLYFKKEEELLATVDNPEEYNKEVLFPKKVLINLEYIRNYSVFMDFRYILGTVIPPFAPSCKIGE